MPSNLVSPSWEDYEYLDSGDGARLERFGPFIFNRPAPVAIWRPAREPALWARADATYVRHSDGSGEWHPHRKLPESWRIRRGDISLEMRMTGFGHVGLFAEQAPNWEWIRTLVAHTERPLRVLNLFAYTGGTTLAAAAGGAEVCHVDAVRGVVRWASGNAAASGLGDKPIRWIVDDAEQFVRREAARGRRYDAIALDPPSFGRGAKGEIFKLERDLVGLLDLCRELLSEQPLFVLLTCHTPGIGAPVLGNLLAPLSGLEGALETGDALQSGPEAPLPLPCGVYARWLSAAARATLAAKIP